MPLPLFSGIIFLLTSCGYSAVKTNIPGGHKKICIPQIINMTSHNGLVTQLTSALRDEAASSGMALSRCKKNIPELKVTITGIRITPYMTTVEKNGLVNIQNQAQMSVKAVLSLKNDKTLIPQKNFLVRSTANSGINEGIITQMIYNKSQIINLTKLVSSEIISDFFKTP